MVSTDWIDAIKMRAPLVLILGSLLVGCATTSGDSDVPVPLEVINLDDMQAQILALWGTSDREVFKSSSFSEPERFSVLRSTALQRHMSVQYGQKGSVLDNCSALKLLAIRPTTQKNDGSKSEIWDMDACSVKLSVVMEVAADERERIKNYPIVLTPSF